MAHSVLDQIDPRLIGGHLQHLRKKAGLTQQVVAERTRMEHTRVMAIEKGESRVTAPELVELARLYGRPVSEFVNRRTLTDGALAIEAFRRGELSEGQLARSLRTDRVSARMQVEQAQRER